MFEQDISLTLNKVGPKLWRFEGSEPRRVELAALEYFRAHGFRGYFTEIEDYFCKLIVLLSWEIKRPWPQWLFGWRTLIRHCADGALRSSCHSKTYSEIRTAVLNCPPDVVKEKITAFRELEIRDTVWIGKGRTSADIDADDIWSFYQCVGNQGLVDYLDRQLSEHRFKAGVKLQRAQMPGHRIYDYLRKNRPPRGFNLHNYAFFQGSDNWQGCYDLGLNSILPKIPDAATKKQFENLLELAKTQRQITEEKRATEALLDLTLWDDSGIAYVEVKAPKDKLQPHQSKWITALRKSGIRAATAWVSQS